MDASRKANRERNEKTLQYTSPPETLRLEELHESKLTQLLAFVGGLERTPDGKAELERRIRLFGECQRVEGETSGQFYARLRHWLDRDFPQTRPPRQAARQDDDL